MFGSRHRDERFPRGTTLYIDGKLTGTDGVPLDTTGGELQWALCDETGKQSIVLPGTDGLIEITDAPNGVCRITVSAAATARLAPGTYQDFMQFTKGDVVLPLWSGTFKVEDNPFVRIALAEETGP